ncbi:restriction endonuclease subunit S [Pseudomonas tussilaginis]|uniref:restriction endonuclease subunit S n=1 Tax=Pseudomonas sp. 5 TaxID=1619949 RepID=UPI00061E55CC|nr:restriction endonuclease subunit S [Pseudomonas sp. 5]KJK07818.1 hypothetical protein UB47_10350 [Pseudomonas sp. 5]
MTFPAYPGYRDSGVEWLGAVPSYWESWKISHAFGELGSGTTPPTSEAEWYEDGTVPWVTTGELREGVIWETKKLLSSTVLSAFSALRLHPAGSLAIAMYGATIGRLGILGVDATTNQACCLLTRPKHLHVKFTFYWLLVFKQSIIDLYASGGGQPNINQEIIANLKVPAPGIPEQTQIARFLDHETARIGALIEEQQRLIELLKEKRQAVISQVVTKGLDPTVPMKDSGVEWLGEVPAHWERKRLKNISPFITVGIVVNPSDYVAEEGLPFIYGGEVKEGLIEVDKARKISLQDSLRNRKTMLEAGDIVTMRVGYPGLTAVVPPECEGGNCASVMLVKRGGFDSRWLCAVMNSRLVRQQVEVVQYGAAQKQFNIADAIEFWMFKPPLNEQATIAEFVEEQSSIFDDLTAESENSMVLLQERRSALISAAVTGKIDVRGWQPPASAPTPELAQEAV